jgi:hypothetical protein
MKNGRRMVWVLAILAAILTEPAILLAQDPNKPPTPAARESLPLPGLSDDLSQTNPQPVTPDNRPLTGVQTTTLGSPEIRHSYWVPGFEYGNFIRSSSYLNPTVADWNSTSYVGGSFNLLQAWRHAQLNASYSGGGFLSTDSAVGNGCYHQVGLVQQFDWQRWQLAFIDQLAYLPQAQFGFGAGTNLALSGIGGTLGTPPPGLQQSYLPSQSIYSALGPRYSNAFVTQIGYAISPRTSLTLAGSYGILHFTNPGNVDTNDAISSAGYNYELSRHSTLGILYRFSSYHFAGQPQAIGDHTVQLAYGHKITGRLALQLFGGPEMTRFRVPIGTSKQHISGAGAANLTYAFTERTNFSAGYTHAVSGGSGVFTGAITDQVQAGLDQQISRQWHGGIQSGYSWNGTILQTASQTPPHFSTWYAGANVGRALGQYAHFSLAYSAYVESSNQIIATINSQSTSYTQHQVTLEFGWHTAPFVIR